MGAARGWKSGETKRKTFPGAERQRYRWIHIHPVAGYSGTWETPAHKTGPKEYDPSISSRASQYKLLHPLKPKALEL